MDTTYFYEILHISQQNRGLLQENFFSCLGKFFFHEKIFFTNFLKTFFNFFLQESFKIAFFFAKNCFRKTLKSFFHCLNVCSTLSRCVVPMSVSRALEQLSYDRALMQLQRSGGCPWSEVEVKKSKKFYNVLCNPQSSYSSLYYVVFIQFFVIRSLHIVLCNTQSSQSSLRSEVLIKCFATQSL